MAQVKEQIKTPEKELSDMEVDKLSDAELTEFGCKMKEEMKATQIPHDLTLNWNIINRRKKQTKYNQRH